MEVQLEAQVRGLALRLEAAESEAWRAKKEAARSRQEADGLAE